MKECLQVAKDGQPYVVSAVDNGSDASSGGGGGGSDGGAKAREQQAGDDGAALQQQLSKEELAGGSDSVSRRLRGRTVRLWILRHLHWKPALEICAIVSGRFESPGMI